MGAQPTQSSNEQLTSEWPETQWRDIIAHSNVAIGACYFQFSDVEDKSDGKVHTYHDCYLMMYHMMMVTSFIVVMMLVIIVWYVSICTIISE